MSRPIGSTALLTDINWDTAASDLLYLSHSTHE
jgi:hypothetical protein